MRALFLLAALIFFSATGPAAGTGLNQELLKKEKKLEDVQKQIREEKKTVKTYSEKETNVLGEIEDLNKSLMTKKEELRKAGISLAAVQRNVSAAGSNITKLERKKQVLMGRLRSRMRSMYKMKKGQTMQVLFASDSASGLSRRFKYISIIMDSDSDLLSGYEKNLKRLEEEKKRLEALSGEFASARKEAADRKAETEGLQRQKTALLAGIKQEKEKRLHTIRELEQAATDLSDLIDKLRVQTPEAPEAPGPASGFAAMKGKLRMPVEGTIVSFYGKVKHPKFQTVTFNNGIIIEAPEGARVKSVYDGKVIYTGWLKGYGQVLIIDNGGGFYTLYAQLSKILKERGDGVKKGDEVGLVGDTGANASAGLYFEIRQKGVPRDPVAWFAEK